MSDDVIKKENAAAEASKLIEDGMVVGLGSGSTVDVFAKNYLKAKHLEVVVASRSTQILLQSMGIKCYYLDSPVFPDVTVDGADRIDQNLDLIKGGGGALLGEKLLAKRSKEFVIIAEEPKYRKILFSDFPVPVEIEPIAYYNVAKELDNMGLRWKLRSGSGKNGPVVTDNGNWILDLDPSSLRPQAQDLERRLKAITGVVETGLFLGMASQVILGLEAGAKVIKRPRATPSFAGRRIFRKK